MYQALCEKLSIVREKLAKDSKLGWFGIWFLWAVWLSWIYWGFGPSSYLRVHDNGDANFVYRIDTARNILEYGYTFWQPALACGQDTLASGLTGFFSIDLLFFIAFPPWLAYALFMLVQRFFAGYFTYRLCRDPLELDHLSSSFAGVAYSLYKWSVYDWILSLRLGPPGTAFYLWAFEGCIKKGGQKGMLLVGLLGLFASFSTPFTLFTPFFWVFMGVWFVFIRKITLRVFLPCYLVFIVTSSIGQLPEIWALLLNAPFSGRAGSNPYDAPDIIRYITGTFSDFMQQKVAYVLIVLGLLACRFRDRFAIKLVFWGLLFGNGARLWILAVPVFLDYLGPLKGFNFARFGQFHMFLAPVAGAYCLNLLLKYGREHALAIGIGARSSMKLQYLNPGVVAGVLAIVFSAFVSATLSLDLAGRLPSDSYHNNYQHPDLVALASVESSEPFRVATVGTRMATYRAASGDDIHPAYAVAYGFETVDGYFSLLSRRYQKYWEHVVEGVFEYDDVLQRNKQVYLDRWTYLYRPFGKPFDKTQFSVYYNLNLLSLANVRYFISRWKLDDDRLRLIRGPEDVFVQKQKWHSLSKLDKIAGYLTGQYPPRPLYIYENPSVFPRVFIGSRMRVFETPESLLDELKNATSDEIHRTIFLEEGDVSGIQQPFSSNNSRTRIVEYTPDRIVVDVNADGYGIMVLTNNYSPFWKARLGGEERKILPVYHTFQGIYIEPGQYQVVFEYQPPYRAILGNR